MRCPLKTEGHAGEGAERGQGFGDLLVGAGRMDGPEEVVAEFFESIDEVGDLVGDDRVVRLVKIGRVPPR
ncbi:hypothetical protein GCM10010530_40650 [Kribbella aluminosa]